MIVVGRDLTGHFPMWIGMKKFIVDMALEIEIWKIGKY